MKAPQTNRPLPMRKLAPTGKGHAYCTTHVQHAAGPAGWLCILPPRGQTVETRTAEMLAFADHIAVVAARHAFAERSAPVYGRLVKVNPQAIATWRLNTGRMAPGAGSRVKEGDELAYGPFLAECDWSSSVLSCQVPLTPVTVSETVAETVIAAPAPVIRKARARKAAPVVAPVADAVVRDALAYCNGCDRPSADLDPFSGYCAECMSHDRRHEYAPARPVEAAPEPTAEPCDDCGIVGYHRCAANVAAIEEAQRIVAALPIVHAPVQAPVTAATRPTCPRCSQVFRKAGTGYAWHLANRPDCAGPVILPAPSAPVYAPIGA